MGWDASRLDQYPYEVVTHYSVWRSLTGPAALALMAKGRESVEPSSIGPDFKGRAYRFVTLGSATHGWEWLGNMNAHNFAQYTYTAPTLFDSTDAHPGYQHFLVAAHSSSAFAYWDSPADSGYSVDNLPREIPRSFAVACNTGSGNQLSWSANSDEDCRYYRIYRGYTPDFTPHWLNMVNWTTATRYTDGEYDGWNVYYKLTAVDYSGNESAPA